MRPDDGTTDRVRAALSAGRSVVVRGEAGAGKTRLVTAALRGLAGLHVLDVPVPARRPWTTAPVLPVLPVLPTAPAGARVVLRLEDAHLLDDAAARAVQRAARGADAALVVTTRTATAVDPDPLPELPPEDVEVVDLGPLDVAAVEQVLRELLGGPATAATTHRLWAESRGNPFHLHELVRDQLEQGAFTVHDGVWQWAGTCSVGPRVVDAALHDLAALDDAERAAVEIAAFTGPVPADRLARASSPRALRELLRLGHLRAHDGVLDVGHPLWAEAVWSVTSTARRREVLHAARHWPALTDVPAGSGTRGARAVARALELGLPLASTTVRGAVDAAIAAHDPWAALDVADAALGHGSWAGAQRAELLTVRAEAHLQLGRPTAALHDVTEARVALERSATDADDATVAAHLSVTRFEATLLHLASDDLDDALALLDRTAAWVRRAARGPSRARALDAVEACRLTHLAHAGRHAEMLDGAVALLLGGEDAGPPPPHALAALAAPTMHGLALAGRHAELEEVAATYVVAASPATGPDRWTSGALAVAHAMGRLQAGDLAGAGAPDQHLDAVTDRLTVHLRAGLLHAAHGRWADARADLRSASARLRAGDMVGVLPLALAAEAGAAAAVGDVPGARELLAELDRTPRRFAQLVGPLIDLLVVDALARLRDAQAVERAAALAGRAGRDGMRAVELEALHRSVVLAAGDPPAAAIARVAELAEVVATPRAVALAAHAHALCEPDPARRGARAARAEAALQRCGVWLPATAAPVELTRRELEIATFAAGGLTSREIARRLTLSVRTVDSHLSRAFAKLGVHSRDGLAGVLARR